MGILNPFAFGFLAVVPVIVLLYLLKVKRRSVRVATLLFWQKIMRENRRRSLFQRFRQIFSLLLHLLIFLLILLALARPELKRFAGAGSSTVLVVDTRARMQTLEADHRPRIEGVKRLLRDYAAHAGRLNQIALLSADGAAEVRVPFSEDEKELGAGIAALNATDCGGSLEPALQLAAQLLASRPGEKRLVIFSDRLVEWRGAGKEIAVETVAAGTSQGNVAILEFAARSLPGSPDTSEVLLEIGNFRDTKAAGNAEIRLEGRLLDVVPYTLDPGGRRQFVFSSIPSLPTGARGWLSARLDKADPLTADNEAYAVLPPREPARVLLVTKGNRFLEKVLAADQQVRFELLAPDSFQPAMAADFDAVILDDSLPPGLDLDHLEGNFLFVRSTPFAAAGEPLIEPLVTDTDSSSPLLRLVNLRNVTFLRAAALDLSGTTGAWRLESPLRSFDHPLVVTGIRRPAEGRAGPERRMAAFAFDVTESDLPLRIAFPLLMANTVQWLSGGNGLAPAAGVRCGETIDPGPGGKVASVPVRPDAGGLGALPPEGGLLLGAFRPLANGFYLRDQNGKRSWIAVNTFSETESDLRFKGAAPASGPGAHSWIGRRIPIVSAWPIWMDLALAAFVLFTMEWWLYHRRRTE